MHAGQYSSDKTNAGSTNSKQTSIDAPFSVASIRPKSEQMAETIFQPRKIGGKSAEISRTILCDKSALIIKMLWMLWQNSMVSSNMILVCIKINAMFEYKLDKIGSAVSKHNANIINVLRSQPENPKKLAESGCSRFWCKQRKNSIEQIKQHRCKIWKQMQ